MMISLVIFVALSLLSQGVSSEVKTVYISNQNQFDIAVESINQGREAHLVLGKGRYVLKTSLTVKSPLSIRGEDAIISCASELTADYIIGSTASHFVFKLPTSLSLFPLIYDQNGGILPISESVIDSIGVNYLEGDIVAPKEYGVGVVLKIPISSNLMHLRNKSFPCAYGYLDSGWRTVSFQLTRSDSKYFYCTTLTECPTKDFQYDKNIYKKPVRYVIYNAEQKSNAVYFDKNRIFVPKNTKKVYYLNNSDSEHEVRKITVSSDLELDNVQFVGFSGLEINSQEKGICNITSCCFVNTLGYALAINKKNSGNARVVNVRNCTFKSCSLYEDNMVLLTSPSNKRICISIEGCEMSRYPDSWVMYKNSKPTISINADALVKNNRLINNCRGHLGLSRGEIIVRNNTIYNTDKFNEKVDRNLSNDWGLIYCNHIFKDTDAALNNDVHHILIERNLLYGAYAWGGDARGVFIDDGRGDVECRDNVILDTQLYSIDSRNVQLHDASSVRNRFVGNIVTSNYRLYGGPAVQGEDVPVISGNTILSSISNKTDNTLTLVDDIKLDLKSDTSFSEGRVLVSRELYKVLRKSSAWSFIKQWVRRDKS